MSSSLNFTPQGWISSLQVISAVLFKVSPSISTYSWNTDISRGDPVKAAYKSKIDSLLLFALFIFYFFLFLILVNY